MSEKNQPSVQSEADVVKVPCEVYSRIVGYLRPVQAWNQGKRQEFLERRVFKTRETEEAGS
jgi:anaerobic ribonucleoside-triphosphate reductase